MSVAYSDTNFELQHINWKTRNNQFERNFNVKIENAHKNVTSTVANVV